MSIEASPPAPAPPLLRGRVLALAATVLLLDQATKYWAVAALTDAEPVDVLGSLLRLRLVYNPGAAFSLGAGSTWIFALATALAVIGLGWLATRVRSRGWAVALGLMLGGATTHLLDRLFREPGFARGHVVDFIDYAGFFVGNVADIALVSGAVALAALSLADIRLDARPDRP